MKLSVTMFLGLMLVMLAVTVSGKPKTYLIETADNIDNPVTFLISWSLEAKKDGKNVVTSMSLGLTSG